MRRLIAPSALALALTAAAAAIVVAAPAAADPVPADKLGLIVLRVLAYDHRLEAMTDGDVVIAVVETDDAPARACGAAMASALTALAKKVSIHDLTVKAVRLTLVGDKALARALIKQRAVAVYACTSAAQAPAVSRATRQAATLSFTAEPAAIADLAIALVRRDDKIELQVNLVAARAEAAQLSGAFLRIAKVVNR